MTAVALAAMLGAFGGSGPLAAGTVGERGDALRLHYKRIARRHAPNVLRVEVAPGVAHGGLVTVVFDREYLDGLAIERIVPRPEREVVTPASVEFLVRVADPTRPSTVSFLVEPEAMWRRRGAVWLAGGRRVAFQQFVYP